MVFAWDFDDGRKSCLVGVDLLTYPVRDLCSDKSVVRMRGTIRDWKLDSRHRPQPPCHPYPKIWAGQRQETRRTCWFMRTIPMSFLFCVYSSKASSIFRVSVLPSTTRKFLCGVGPAVTC